MSSNAEINASPQHFMVSKRRGNKIHIRCYLPKSVNKSTRILFFAHGYAAHCNRKHSFIEFFSRLSANGIVVFAHDHVGHGYSSGMRSHISDFEALLDDWEDLIDLVTGNNEAEVRAIFGDSLSENVISLLPSLSFILSGMSLGGLVSSRMAQRLASKTPLLLGHSNLAGLVLLCPLIETPPGVPRFIEVIIRWLVMFFSCGHLEMPGFLDSTLDDGGVNPYNRTQIGADLMEKDDQNLPGGLGYKGNIRWDTGFAILDGTRALDFASIKKHDCPVLCFHDPEDKIVGISNSYTLITEIKHPKSKLVCLNDGRHDLLGNDIEDVATIVAGTVDWITTLD
jgi:alpha-beta hydrolase superfamily lysophospholipase